LVSGIAGMDDTMYYCCLRTCDNCLTCHVKKDITCISGLRLREFTIAVGPNDGVYTLCGSHRNRMATQETTAFMCRANTTGISVKIQIRKMHRWLTLCEVFIFGRGMVEVNICTATNQL